MPSQYPPDFAEWYDKYRYAKGWTEKECDFLESVMREHCQSPPGRLLDLACGTGRHAIELARRGYRVTGIDISHQMIDLAKKKAGNLELDFHVMDMRNLSLREEFGFAYMWFSSFPFLVTNNDAISTLRGIHRSLVQGGVFVFQYSNPWKRALGEEGEPVVHKHEDADIKFVQTSTRTRCPEGNLIRRTIKTRRWSDGKEMQPIVEDFLQRIYSVDEVDLLARLTHFELATVYGSPDTRSKYPQTNDEIIPVLISQ